MMYEELYWTGASLFLEELERANDRNEVLPMERTLWWMELLVRLIKIRKWRGEL